jgi:hypothetical protein
MSETMTELLKRWSELEPERCEYQEETEYYHVMRNGRWAKATIIATLDYDRIQGAVQEAINVHEWPWSVDCKSVEDEEYTASIIGGSFYAEEGSNDTPAAALLSAYLKALEAKS